LQLHAGTQTTGTMLRRSKSEEKEKQNYTISLSCRSTCVRRKKKQKKRWQNKKSVKTFFLHLCTGQQVAVAYNETAQQLVPGRCELVAAACDITHLFY